MIAAGSEASRLLDELAAAADRVAKAAEAALETCPAIPAAVELEMHDALRHWARTKASLINTLKRRTGANT